MSHLIDRRLYRIASRNLKFGVWKPDVQGFVGIREKFRARFLDVEYHRETGPPFGTAIEVADTGMDVPPEIGTHVSEPTACGHCGQPVFWPGTSGESTPWLHGTDIEHVQEQDHAALPQSRQNKLLFQWLEAQEKEADR